MEVLPGRENTRGKAPKHLSLQQKLAIIMGYPEHSHLGQQHETHIPTFQDPPGPHPRVPRTHEDARRTGGYQCAAGKRAQAPGSLRACVRKACCPR